MPLEENNYEEDDDEEGVVFPIWLGFILGLMVIFAFVEVIILGASFIFADKIECNWFMCS